MAKKTQKEPGKVVEPEAAKAAPTDRVVTLTEYYSKKQVWGRFRQWMVGTSPLICHAWSEKAKREMLAKMVKAVKPAKEERKPNEEFTSSLYEMGDGNYGFPVTAVKKCILSQAHKDRGIPKTTVQAGLWLDFEIIQQRPALAGALCDMPIVRIHGSEPQMREDMVRIKGRGGSTANFAYRAQFSNWAIRLTGKVDPEQVPFEVLCWLIQGGGLATGLGDWRNEKSGVFGGFRLATPEEAQQWEKFASGKGPLPKLAPVEMLEAAE
jgi:hypothetical protein